MIRHIVMFQLKEFASPTDKMAKMNEVKTKLEGLINKIDILLKINVDFNINPTETWDLILTTEFNSLDDLQTYASHPDHVIISKDVIGPIKADRACVDYEF